jgi:hypothetical protein
MDNPLKQAYDAAQAALQREEEAIRKATATIAVTQQALDAGNVSSPDELQAGVQAARRELEVARLETLAATAAYEQLIEDSK